MHEIALPAVEAVVRLNPCDAPPPVPVVTAAAPVRERQSLYVTAKDCLYALNAADGTTRWCQQVTLIRTREVSYPRGMSVPPPPRVMFAAPRVVDGVVCVCIDGFGSYTCAFDAGDGSLRWWTPTDARVMSMPFMDFAVPLVSAGIIYSGSYALNARDGTVRWRIPIDTREEGTLALNALVDGTIYATTWMGIYAISAQDGQIRWRYQPDDPRFLSGPPVVAGHLLYAGTRTGHPEPARNHRAMPRSHDMESGTSGSAAYPQTDYCCALDVATGAEVWRFPLFHYIGAVVHDETIYVSSGDRSLYALDKNRGLLRWQRRLAPTGYYPATIADDVLYLNAIGDGAYALSGEDGAVLWHQLLGNGPGASFTFTPSVVLDGAVYLGRIDNRGWGVLYALDARTGAECWHTPYPRNSLHAPFAVAK